ncbi:hypothetical protein E4634_08535 [Mangrovimicrobium sediminis]|uniref:Uncharacterized protein n=1 Tax=Mangrovimicrobium sediminis TaxID=2562682 RepID=A0A4Z0M407_9GAMM|nr:diacylglycerol kinase family protein [Haliea sp. SAOS-164]TGD74167.1 hypothetical protein E4634_08535 [Haliea sp. SAOS-164]
MNSLARSRGRLAAAYLLAAAALLGTAFLWRNPLWLLPALWSALSLAAVGVAYALNNPMIFRKNSSGEIPPWISWLLVPFFLGVYAYNYLQHRRDGAPNIQRVDDGIHVSGRLTQDDVPELRSLGIGAVLDVTAEFNALDRSLVDQPIHYLNIPVLDHSVPTASQLNRAVNWIDRRIRSGQQVVVHCALGRGRSVLVIVAYLLASGRCDTRRDAEALVRRTRTLARLNPAQAAFIEQLHASGELCITRNACVIANPVAGGGKWERHRERVEEQLSQFYRLQIKTTTPETGASILAEEALAEGADLIIAGGGDGTLAEVASVLVGSETLFGILPLGTANALSHALFGNLSKLVPMETALAALTHGRPVSIDTADCNGETMLLVAALGFEEQMISHADREEKNGLGQGAYLQGFWRALVDNATLELEVRFDDEDSQRISTSSMVIANASPATSILAQGGGLPDYRDGELDITWLKPGEGARQNLGSMLELMGSVDGDSVIHRRASAVAVRVIEGQRRHVVDGEPRESGEVKVRVVPASLTVLVPAGSATTASD